MSNILEKIFSCVNRYKYKDSCYSIYYNKKLKQYVNIIEKYKATQSSSTCINIKLRKIIIGKKLNLEKDACSMLFL